MTHRMNDPQDDDVSSSESCIVVARGILLGSLLGYVSGLLWNSVLVLFLLNWPSVAEISTASGKKQVTYGVIDAMLYLIVFSIPWGIVGIIVWGIARIAGSVQAIIYAFCGMVLVGIWTLSVERHDGWLAIQLPLNCLLGTAMGLLLGISMSRISSYLRRRARKGKSAMLQ